MMDKVDLVSMVDIKYMVDNMDMEDNMDGVNIMDNIGMVYLQKTQHIKFIHWYLGTNKASLTK